MIEVLCDNTRGNGRDKPTGALLGIYPLFQVSAGCLQRQDKGSMAVKDEEKRAKSFQGSHVSWVADPA